MSKSRLGKGLGALIAENEDSSNESGKFKNVFVHQIEPNPFQPRQEFDMDDLKELAQSIKENGVIQPITLRQVRPTAYQLVTGERRWRASRMIGLKKIPAIIRNYTDLQMMETALIENIQREDLNPIEEAQAYNKMLEEFEMTQVEVAEKVGKSRSTVANTVRLLNLSPKVQVYVSRETLTMGHARALLSLKDNKSQINAAEYIINNKLSVRETERYIQKINDKEKKDDNKRTKRKKKKVVLEPKWIDARKRISNYLNTKVSVKESKGKKVVSIECKRYKDIERLIKKLS